MVMDQQVPQHPESIRINDNKGPCECHLNGNGNPYGISHPAGPASLQVVHRDCAEPITDRSGSEVGGIWMSEWGSR